MEKVCIFCGKRPGSKNMEHVLPQWLIRLTGNPRRMARFGYDKDFKRGQFVERRFSFGAFKFPSCEECNQEFSDFEGNVKLIVEKMMVEDSISESELSTLLDWFDKVRIGLWLAFLYLDKNPLGIRPGFYVQNRIRQYDRMLAIFKVEGNTKGLHFAGCETAAFASSPSCFSLHINNLCFLNMSYPNLLARRMGFPFPVKTYVMEDDEWSCSYSAGRNRIMRPILRKSLGIKGIELYQPIFFGNVADEDNEGLRRLYDTEYVRDNCISWEKGIGRIYIKRDSKVSAYTTYPSMEWLPERIHDFEELKLDIQLVTLECQLYIISKIVEPSVEFVSGETKRQMIGLVNVTKESIKGMLKALNKVKRY